MTTYRLVALAELVTPLVLTRRGCAREAGDVTPAEAQVCERKAKCHNCNT